MPKKKFKISRKVLITWLILSASIFLLLPQSITKHFQFAFLRTFRVPLSIGHSISLSTKLQRSMGDVVSREQYDKLLNHSNNQAQELIQQRENFKKLSSLYDNYPWANVRFQPCQVITNSQQQLIIDRGQLHGITKGQYVIADNSIIGKISEVTQKQSKVTLITDPESAIPVKIDKLDSPAVMKGLGNGLAAISLSKYQAKEGENVFAEKRPALLDSPIITGKVFACEREMATPLLWQITIKPACDLEKIKDVAVIIMEY